MERTSHHKPRCLPCEEILNGQRKSAGPHEFLDRCCHSNLTKYPCYRCRICKTELMYAPEPMAQWTAGCPAASA